MLIYKDCYSKVMYFEKLNDFTKLEKETNELAEKVLKETFLCELD